MAFDVHIPDLPPDFYWLGGLNLFIDCPNVGLWNRWVGYQALQILFDDQFNTVQFALPQDVTGALTNPVALCRVALEIFSNPQLGEFILLGVHPMKTVQSRMREGLVGVLVLLVWGGCSGKGEAAHDDDVMANSGGTDGSSGGTSTDRSSSLLAEGEVLLGSCMAPVGNGCRDFLSNSDGFTTEDAYQRCAESYTGGFSEELWSEGEHCPLVIAFRTYVRTAVGACKIGPHEGTSFAEVTYIYFSSRDEEREVAALQEYCEGQFYSFEE